MTIRRYDATQQKWVPVTPKTYSTDTKTWEPVPTPPNSNLWAGGVAKPYIGENTIWTEPSSKLKISSNSDQYRDWVVNHSTYNGFVGRGIGINSDQYGTPPIPVYVIDSSLPGMDYQYVDSVDRVDALFAKTYLLGKIPWPAGALPVTYQDKSIAIWDRYTGIMREYFYMTQTSPGHWAASSGGGFVAKPDFEDLGEYNYATQLITGTSAVVGQFNELGFADAVELLDTTFDKNGLIQDCAIKHGLAFTSSSFSSRGPSWPARDSDGQMPDQWAPCEGQRARIVGTLDPHYNPKTKKPYNKLEQALIVAGQDYFIEATDRNDAIIAANLGGGAHMELLTGQSPYERRSTSDMSLNGSVIQKYAVGSDVLLSGADFPLDQLEWADIDYGRPQVDFFPRQHQIGIYVDPAIQ